MTPREWRFCAAVVLAGALAGAGVAFSASLARSLFRAVVDEIDALELQDLDDFELEWRGQA